MELLVTIIILALIFDYINGFHDAANSIATIVSTRVLTPFQAVLWAAFFNFVAFFIAKYIIGGFGIANTVSKTVVEQYITLPIILAGVIAAITWNLVTWWKGIPSSSSHTLIGGFAGAAIMANGFEAIQLNIILKIAAFIFLAPFIGMVIAFGFTLFVINKNDVVAEVNGEQILLSELASQSKQEIFDILNTAYEIKSRVLAGLIKQKLLEDAAKKENMSLEEFIDWFVQQKICVGQDSLKKRYGFNTQSFYVKGELIPLVKGSLEEKLSYQQKLRSRIVQALVDSLYQKADIKRFLYPPKQPECVVRDLCVYYRGNLDSPVSFIVASDYNCERCVQFEKTLSKLYDNYKERVKFGFVHFADAPSLAALACEAAGEQKQFWTFHDTIFNYSGVADSAFIYNLAKSKRLNMTEFDAYLHSSDKYKEMDKVINQLVERGLMATPTIIINDRLVYVTNSYEELSRLLEYEL